MKHPVTGRQVPTIEDQMRLIRMIDRSGEATHALTAVCDMLAMIGDQQMNEVIATDLAALLGLIVDKARETDEAAH